MRETCLFLQVAGSPQASPGSRAGPGCAWCWRQHGRSRAGTTCPLNPCLLWALGLPISLNPSAITALISGCTFCPPSSHLPVSLSLLSQKGYELSLVWKSLSHQKDGLVSLPSTLPPSFFLPLEQGPSPHPCIAMISSNQMVAFGIFHSQQQGGFPPGPHLLRSHPSPPSATFPSDLDVGAPTQALAGG